MRGLCQQGGRTMVVEMAGRRMGMQMQNGDSGDTQPVSGRPEVRVEHATAQLVGKDIVVKGCQHGRLIDHVLTKEGKRTSKVRCLECGAKLDDPHLGLK
jgi:hypothetical protein